MSDRGTGVRIILILALAAGACGHPEQRLIDRYFVAVNSGDNQTLSSFAIVSFDKKVERWAINLTSEERRSPVGDDVEGTLPYLVKKVQETQEAIDGNKKAAKEYRDAHYDEWEQVVNLKKEAKVPAKLQPAKAKYDEFSENERSLRKALSAAREAVDKERHNVQLSMMGQVADVDSLQGELVTKELDLTLTINGQPQPYAMTLRRYDLKNAAGAQIPSRWVVFALAPKG